MIDNDAPKPKKQPIRQSWVSGDQIPETTLARIGEIIVRWSYIEFQLGALLREGLNISPATGRALIVGMEIQVLCGALRTLAHTDGWIKDKTICQDITKLANDVGAKKQDRHDYAHGVFGFNVLDPSLGLARFLFKDKEHRIKPGREGINDEGLRALAEEARDLGIRAQDLTVRVKAWKQSSGLQRPR